MVRSGARRPPHIVRRLDQSASRIPHSVIASERERGTTVKLIFFRATIFGRFFTFLPKKAKNHVKRAIFSHREKSSKTMKRFYHLINTIRVLQTNL